MKKTLKIIGLSLGSIFLLACGVQGYLLTEAPGQALRPNTYRQDITYSTIPTVLIPGWGGNTTTYSKMIKSYQQQNIAQKVMTVWVAPNGRIWTEGDYHGQKNALIQVLYTWNYSSTYQPQVRELTTVFNYLVKHCHLQTANIIAHSYGGTEFVHAYLGSKYLQQHLHLNKLVFLGVPVEESLGDQLKYHYHLVNRSTDQNFHRLLQEMKKWHPAYQVKIYNIMGSTDADHNTDGSVPHIQSEMLRALIKAQPTIEYQQKVYPHTTHFQLHHKTAIIKQIAQILWQKDQS